MADPFKQKQTGTKKDTGHLFCLVVKCLCHIYSRGLVSASTSRYLGPDLVTHCLGIVSISILSWFDKLLVVVVLHITRAIQHTRKPFVAILTNQKSLTTCNITSASLRVAVHEGV